MHPIVFQTNFFILYTFWLFFALAIFAVTYAIIKLSIKNGLKIQFLSENWLKLVLSALIGARIFSLIEHYNIYFSKISTINFLEIFAIWDKGLNLLGGIIGALLFLYFKCKKSDQDFWKWLDILVPSVIIGLAICHIGAFFEGINYGHETSLPWGVNFESPSIKYAVPIHPTQIYAFIYSTAIAISLIILNKKKSGSIGIIGIMAYSFFRFLEEFLRGDDTLTIFEIRVPQILALIIFIATGIFLYHRYNKSNSLINKQWHF